MKTSVRAEYIKNEKRFLSEPLFCRGDIFFGTNRGGGIRFSAPENPNPAKILPKLYITYSRWQRRLGVYYCGYKAEKVQCYSFVTE